MCIIENLKAAIWIWLFSWHQSNDKGEGLDKALYIVIFNVGLFAGIVSPCEYSIILFVYAINMRISFTNFAKKHGFKDWDYPSILPLW